MDVGEHVEKQTPLSLLRDRVGLEKARTAASNSDYATSLLPVIDAVVADPERLWRPHDAVLMAKVVSAFNLDRTLRKATGFDFAELLNNARLDLALRRLAEGGATVDEIAEGYWPPRTRAQQLKELGANVAVVDNKLSSRENLDGALRKSLDLGLDDVIGRLRP